MAYITKGDLWDLLDDEALTFAGWLLTGSPEASAMKLMLENTAGLTLDTSLIQYQLLPMLVSAGVLTQAVVDRVNAEIEKQNPVIPESPIFQMSEHGATMKILKIKVGVDVSGKMLYPDGFFTVQYLEHIYCDDIPNNICWMLILIEGSELVKITDITNITEITLDEARLFVAPYDKKITKIVDEGMIRAIEIKSRMGITLTDAEKAAIDPNDSTLGINYQQTFVERLEQRMGV